MSSVKFQSSAVFVERSLQLLENPQAEKLIMGQSYLEVV